MCSLYFAILLLLSLSHWIGSGCEATIVLANEPVEAEENSSVVLSCYGASDPINGVMFWMLNDRYYGVNLTDNPCRALRHPLNRTDIYTISCSGIHNISLTINNIDMLQHGDKWQCQFGFERSNVVTMYVKVPVATLDLTFSDKGFLAEKQTTHFYCKSSFSRPKAEIYWFISYGTQNFQDDDRLNSTIKVSDENTTVGNRTDNILTCTKSELTVTVQRSINNKQIYCLTNDTSGRILRSTMETLSISYPPDGPPFIRGSGNNGRYNVINKYQGNLSCIVTGGNPPPHLNWICLQTGTETLWISNKTVARDFTWTASLDNNEVNCTCQSLWLRELSSASVRINVLYPPRNVSVTLQYLGSKFNINNYLDVFEYDSFHLTCSGLSKPKANYFWSGKTTSFPSHILEIASVNKSVVGNYTCHAVNSMQLLNGTYVKGEYEVSIYLRVLFPASVGALKNISAQEGSDIHISCPVIPGNTAYTNISWARENDTKYWNGTELVILDVTREDSTVYTCTIISTMLPTFGISKIEEQRNQFYLSVFSFERTSQNSHVEVVVGTVFAVAAVTVGIMAGIFIYRKRYQKKTNSGTEAKSHDEVSEMKTISGNNSFKKEPVYEGLQPHTERGAEEPRENPYSKLKLDKDPQSTASPVYTNLTL